MKEQKELAILLFGFISNIILPILLIILGLASKC